MAIIDVQELSREGYMFITSRAVAAAALFIASPKDWPNLDVVHIYTDVLGYAYAEAADGYRVIRATSRPLKLAWNNTPQTLLFNPVELKDKGLITTSPKKSAWLAIREDPNEFAADVILFEWDDVKAKGLPEMVRRDKVTMGLKSFPKLDQFFDWEYAPMVESVPALNTMYLIEIFKAISKAAGPEAATQIAYGGLLEPVQLLGKNKHGDAAHVVVMPIRTDDDEVFKVKRKRQKKVA